MKKLFFLPACLLIFYFAGLPVRVAAQDYEQFARRYRIDKVYIPMRDGTHLFTVICSPRDTTVQRPILLERTPYCCQRDTLAMAGSSHAFTDRNYIMVLQDVRGKGMSEGAFENMRPLTFDTARTDEGTDTWDTVDWLLKHTRNNGRVGLIGTSYPGFYAAMGALCRHPAIKAVVPQAPCYDWFAGDDMHHGGAFMLIDAIDFIHGFDAPHRGPVSNLVWPTPFARTSAYNEMLQIGPLKNLNRFFGDSIEAWKVLCAHPNYDDYWRTHNLASSCRDSLSCAVLVTGGTYDAEDCFGAFSLYQKLKEISRPAQLSLVAAPWYHGWWFFPRFAFLGNIYLGEEVHRFYEDEVLLPFFNCYLNGTGKPFDARATLFFTGENCWRTFGTWPVATTPMRLFLQKGGKLSTQEKRGSSHASYLSNPASPVPYTAQDAPTRDVEYMIEDQRFAASRPDVLTYTGEALDDTLRIAGKIGVDLYVSLSSTDADFVVKLIDVYPRDFTYTDAQKDSMKAHGDYDSPERQQKMQGYMFPVRMDILRGRFRNSLSAPQPFVPGQVTHVHLDLNDVAHAFLPGHRVAVQVQSSWFPLADRNPQTFVPNIYTCDSTAFVPCKVEVWQGGRQASSVTLPVMP